MDVLGTRAAGRLCVMWGCNASPELLFPRIAPRLRVKVPGPPVEHVVVEESRREILWVSSGSPDTDFPDFLEHSQVEIAENLDRVGSGVFCVSLTDALDTSLAAPLSCTFATDGGLVPLFAVIVAVYGKQISILLHDVACSALSGALACCVAVLAFGLAFALGRDGFDFFPSFFAFVVRKYMSISPSSIGADL